MSTNVLDTYEPREARELLGVSKARFYELAKRPDFPVPLRRVAGVPLYDGPGMRAYAKERRRR